MIETDVASFATSAEKLMPQTATASQEFPNGVNDTFKETQATNGISKLVSPLTQPAASPTKMLKLSQLVPKKMLLKQTLMQKLQQKDRAFEIDKGKFIVKAA